MARNYDRYGNPLPHTQNRNRNRNSNSASAGKQNPIANAQAPEPLTPLQQAMLQEADTKMRVRIDGKDQEITAASAVLKKLKQTALGGSSHALGQYLRNLQHAQAIKAREIAKEVALGKRLKQVATKGLKELTAIGVDPKLCPFHPDDVIVQEGVGFFFTGPLSYEDPDLADKICALRDVLFNQASLERRLGPIKTDEAKSADEFARKQAAKKQAASGQATGQQNTGHETPSTGKATQEKHDRDQLNQDDRNQDELDHKKLDDEELGDQELDDEAIDKLYDGQFDEIRKRPDAAAMVAALHLDSLLPKRFQLSNIDFVMMDDKLERLTKRELLTEMSRQWRALGHPRPRGWRMQSLEKVETDISLITQLCKDIVASGETGTPMTEREIFRRLMKLM